MATKLSKELLKRLDEIKGSKAKEDATAASTQEIPVIITVTADADITALEEKGFKLDLKFENIPAVSGTLPADKNKIENFAEELDQVKLIEPEGEMHAL